MKSYSYGTTPIKVIEKALAANLGNKPYNMELVGEDRIIVSDIVNQGIDSHLEAFTQSNFRDNGNRLYCDIDQSEMTILLRRLEENGSDEAMLLRIDILGTIDIEEI